MLNPLSLLKARRKAARAPRTLPVSATQILISCMATAPVDVHALAATLRIAIKPTTMPDHMAGWIEVSDGRWTIAHNDSVRTERTRWTIAHMIGHFAHDFHLVERHGINDTMKYRQDPTVRPFNPLMNEQGDAYANMFAADLLMPRHILIEMMDLRAMNVFQIADALQVSVQAANIRMKSIKTAPSRRSNVR